MKKAVLVTGTNGGIGAAVKNRLESEGYSVIGCGLSSDSQACDEYIQVDFAKLAADSKLQSEFTIRLRNILEKYRLCGLVNNSAAQILAPFDSLTLKDFQETINVNLCIPFLLSKICLASLEKASGVIVNIGSIHARLTKKDFVAYATSKGALETLTKAMAVDLGGRVKVNLVSPAAIETEMLKAGFMNDPDGYDLLKSYHPAGVIGQAAEVADIVYHLINSNLPFLTGSIIDVSGGISSKLHDPN